MKRIAVDIVLLPETEIINKAIELNRELLKQYPNEIVLNRKNCLPHISLAMGCINEEQIPSIENILVEIAANNPVSSLDFIGFHTDTNSSGQKITVVQVKKTKAIQSLHEEVMTKMKEFFSFKITPEMLISDENISNSTLLWIESYPEKSSYRRFSPHITLGYGQLDDYSFPFNIPVSKLAICHLGNHCTCVKILASTII